MDCLISGVVPKVPSQLTHPDSDNSTDGLDMGEAPVPPWTKSAQIGQMRVRNDSLLPARVVLVDGRLRLGFPSFLSGEHLQPKFLLLRGILLGIEVSTETAQLTSGHDH